VFHEGTMNGGDDRVVRDIGKEPPMVSGAGFDGV
jgi:hypothetical protein